MEALALTGLRQTSIAALLGIGEDAWTGVIESQSEVADAFARGRSGLEQELVGLLLTHAPA